MNPTDPRPDRPPPEWLAGYADGELDEIARRAVEEWLRHDPAARDELLAQQALSPRNESFWQSTAPPLPDEPAWGGVRDRIEHRLRQPATLSGPARPARAWWLAGTLALATTAAAVFVVLEMLNDPRPRAAPPAPPATVEEDLDPVFRLAAADDVEIISIPNAAAGLLVVGRLPWDGDVVKLAAFEDIDIRAIGPDARGEFPELHMTPHGVASPMVWPAAREER